MPNRLLVTGCGGFVGGTIAAQVAAQGAREAAEAIELHAVSRREPPALRKKHIWHKLDLTDTAAVDELFETVAPDALIHAAAVADIDFCQANKKAAWQANVTVTQQLAQLCREQGARMVFVSTDNVFDGNKGAYLEEDRPSPINYYGETKLAAERAVAALGVNYAIARTALVVGFPAAGSGNSFLSRLEPLLRDGKRVGVPENEIRSPIDSITLARALLELASADFDGSFHLAGNDILNRFDMARRIARQLGCDERLIYPNNPETIPGRAPRPLDVSLCNDKARNRLRTPMKSLRDGLQLALDSRQSVSA